MKTLKQRDKEGYIMYEYECLGCNTKYYSAAEYRNLNDIKCDICGDYVFYSVDELYQHFGDIEWLTQAYSDLEKKINEDLFDKL
jgi:transcription elongation factor Elf1